MTDSAVAGRGDLWGPPLARSVLFVLVALFGVAPFSPLVAPVGQRGAAASAVLSAVFLYLALTSWSRPVRSFWAGFGLLGLVILVGSMTGVAGSAPVWWVWLLFLLVLAFGALVAPVHTDTPNPSAEAGSEDASADS